jgi:hypothetical protein
VTPEGRSGEADFPGVVCGVPPDWDIRTVFKKINNYLETTRKTYTQSSFGVS